MNDKPSYHVWREIDYQPAVENYPPDALLPYLPPNATVLDVGCGRGATLAYLADHGCSVTGVELNPEAVKSARELLARRGVGANTIIEGDFLAMEFERRFDAVLAIRFLTCLPRARDRQRAVSLMRQALVPGGWLFLLDFVQDETLQHYVQRYAAGVSSGLDEGNFSVSTATGASAFIAHHHSESEIGQLMSGFGTLSAERPLLRSLNGHDVRCICLVAQRLEESDASAP